MKGILKRLNWKDLDEEDIEELVKELPDGWTASKIIDCSKKKKVIELIIKQLNILYANEDYVYEHDQIYENLHILKILANIDLDKKVIFQYSSYYGDIKEVQVNDIYFNVIFRNGELEEICIAPNLKHPYDKYKYYFLNDLKFTEFDGIMDNIYNLLQNQYTVVKTEICLDAEYVTYAIPFSRADISTSFADIPIQIKYVSEVCDGLCKYPIKLHPNSSHVGMRVDYDKSRSLDNIIIYN